MGAASCNTKRFVCNQALGTKCAGIIPPPPAAAGKDYCLARLKALPATEGPSVYFDGNSTGDVGEPSTPALAVENPVDHCVCPRVPRPRLSRSAGDDSSAAKSAHRKKIGRPALYPGRFDVSPDLCRKEWPGCQIWLSSIVILASIPGDYDDGFGFTIGWSGWRKII
jgi:hypothetical protein